jgi:hypothetical protein
LSAIRGLFQVAESIPDADSLQRADSIELSPGHRPVDGPGCDYQEFGTTVTGIRLF